MEFVCFSQHIQPISINVLHVQSKLALTNNHYFTIVVSLTHSLMRLRENRENKEAMTNTPNDKILQ